MKFGNNFADAPKAWMKWTLGVTGFLAFISTFGYGKLTTEMQSLLVLILAVVGVVILGLKGKLEFKGIKAVNAIVFYASLALVLGTVLSVAQMWVMPDAGLAWIVRIISIFWVLTIWM